MPVTPRYSSHAHTDHATHSCSKHIMRQWHHTDGIIHIFHNYDYSHGCKSDTEWRRLVILPYIMLWPNEWGKGKDKGGRERAREAGRKGGLPYEGMEKTPSMDNTSRVSMFGGTAAVWGVNTGWISKRFPCSLSKCPLDIIPLFSFQVQTGCKEVWTNSTKCVVASMC